MVPESVYYYFVTAVIAIAALTVAYRMCKAYPLKHLSYYFYYLTFFFAWGFAVRPIKSIFLQILNLKGMQALQFFVAIHFFIAGPLFIAGLYFLIRFAAGLVDIRVSRRFTVIFFMYFGVEFGFRFFLAVQFFKTGHVDTLVITSYIGDCLAVAILLSVHGFVISKSRVLPDSERRKGIRNFGLIFFISLAVFNLSSLVYRHNIVQFILGFAYVLPPLIYLHRFFRRYYREYTPVDAEVKPAGDVFTRYNISKREQEVIQLIARGKTNREISDALYVSLQTVKQHTYNIYRKLNVKNRVQLTNFIRNLSGEDYSPQIKTSEIK